MPSSPTRRRTVHPGAWWAWALALAACAMRTTNVLVLGLTVAVAGVVVAARRPPAAWGRSFAAFLKLGLVLVAVRVALSVAFGARVGEHVLFPLPSVDLPEWMAGVTIGGPVTVELVVVAVREGARLAAVLACFGAANSLSSPYRLLRCLPAVLYEAGVAVTVALAFAPEAVAHVGRVRDARRLRGRPTAGWRGWRGMAMPVLEGALDRSIGLAASMDARGYGRRAEVSRRAHRLGAVGTAGGLLAICVGLYLLFDGGSALALAVLGAGALALAGALLLAGRRVPRTRYRPDPFAGPEWAVLASAAAVLVAFGAAVARDPLAMNPPAVPLTWPEVPWIVLAGLAAAALPAVVTPEPPTLADATEPVPVATGAGR